MENVNEWLTKQMAFAQQTREHYAKHYRHRYKTFEHCGKKIVCADLPFGWRPLSNSTGGLYRFSFTDESGGFVTVNGGKDLRHINLESAKNMVTAINLFIASASTVETGIDALLSN